MLYFVCMNVCFHACICTPFTCLVATQASRRCQMLWDWGYRQLRATVWALVTEPGSSVKSPSALTCWAGSLVSGLDSQRQKLLWSVSKGCVCDTASKYMQWIRMSHQLLYGRVCVLIILGYWILFLFLMEILKDRLSLSLRISHMYTMKKNDQISAFFPLTFPLSLYVVLFLWQLDPS